MPMATGAFGVSAAPSIAIDVGHSHATPGALSARGRPEFAFNLDLARAVAAALASRKVPSVLVGDDGALTELHQRTHLAAERGTGFFVSIHHDSAQLRYFESWVLEGVERRYSDRFSGYSLFVSRKNVDLASSLGCAQKIGFALQAAGMKATPHHAERIPGENREWADEAAGVYFFDNLAVLKTARTPAVLLEAGVIVNRADELLLMAPETHTRIATAVAQGLGDCGATPSVP